MQEQDSLYQKLQIAIALHRSGNFAEASKSYQQVLNLDPNHFDALHLLGVVHYQCRQPEQAVTLITKAVNANDTFADAHNNLGNALKDLKRFDDALASYDRAITLNPHYAEAYYNRGIALQELNRLDDARDSYTHAILLRPDYAEAFCNRGVILQELKSFNEALGDYDQAILLRPGQPLAHNNRGVTLQELGRLDEAFVSYSTAIKLNPDYAEAYSNHGKVLSELKRPHEALASFHRAVTLKPSYAEAYNNLGVALEQLKRFDEALASYDKAISLKADYAVAHYNRGSVLKELKRYEDALESYGKTISLRSDHAEAYSNRGYILHKLKQFNEALANYDRAVSLQPDNAQAHANSGSVLRRLGRHAEAALRYEDALKLDPAYPFAKGMLLHEKMFCASWSGIQNLIDEIDRDISAGKLSVEPFVWQGISHSQRSLQLCAELFNKEKYPQEEANLAHKTSCQEKIRVGYLSGEFREQATSHLLVGLLEHHDSSRFEIYIFDNGWDDQSDIRRRINKAASSVINVRDLHDEAAAKAIRDHNISILVNLNGYFGEERTSIFARRPAPIQVNYLGFPGTLGASYIDYIIADRCVLPEHHKKFYTEKSVYLPHCYQANDNKKKISDGNLTRADLGLPDNGFVFCCFNNVYKITPSTFDIWMRILKQVEKSVLWLLEVPAAKENLRKEAARRGIEPDRIIFAPRVAIAEHLGRHRLADLFLDTLPYNAHTTASDALWAGLPVLTQIGETFAGKVSASLLTTMGLPELITETPKAYEALAIELAGDPDKLRNLKNKLNAHRLSTPLFDTGLFAKHIEAAYTAMNDRHKAGHAPDHIYINP